MADLRVHPTVFIAGGTTAEFEFIIGSSSLTVCTTVTLCGIIAQSYLPSDRYLYVIDGEAFITIIF
jgi:hypothetical protein